MLEFIDSSLFLGMNSINERIRISCKNYFVKKIKRSGAIFMCFEEVGKCDDIIWNYSREEQDAYYPFMDNLHTDIKIKKIRLDETDINIALNDKRLKNLKFDDRLILGMVIAKKGMLITTKSYLLRRKDLPVKYPVFGKEKNFPSKLERLYHKSLKLRIGYSGLIPPLVTPIDNHGNVSEKSVKKLIDFLTPYSSALMPTLSSGEGWALSEKQFIDMIKLTIKYSYNLPVFAGVECKNTDEVICRAKLAKNLGVDAIVITTPFSENISQKEIYNHFKKIKDEVRVPIFIYNEKEISKNSIELKTIKSIIKLGNIVGVKESSGSVNFTKKLKAKLKVPIFQGWEHMCYRSKNVNGYILPLANLEPELCSNMFENPTIEKQNKINFICKKYKLFSKDWYVWLKKELNLRKVITTKKVI